MAQDVGTVFVDIAVQMKKFTQNLAEAVGLSKKAGDSIEEALAEGPEKSVRRAGKKIKEETDKVGKYFKDVSRIVSGIVISQAFYNGLNAIENAVGAVIEFHENVQEATVAFEHLLGSADEARSFTNALQEFASITPFAFEDLTQAAKKMTGFGFSIKATIPLLRVLGDQAAALGGGADTIDGLLRALGQIQTKGRVQAEELNQFAERGVNAFKILREELNLTQEDMQRIGDLHITADQAIPALIRGMQRNTQGLMDKMANTMRGMVSNIFDSLKQIGNNVFDDAFKSMEGVIKRIRDSLQEVTDIVNKQGTGGLFEHLVPKSMQAPIREFLAALKSIIGSLGQFLKAIKPILAAMSQFTAAVLAVAGPIVAVLAKALAVLATFVTRNEGLIKALVFAILSLRIATFIAGSVTKLSVAIRALTVAEVAAKAVGLLGINVRKLNTSLKSNKLFTAISLVAVALVGIALSSKTASKWLDAVIQRMERLLGFDSTGLLTPDDKEIEDDYEKWNQALEDIGYGMEGVGDSADDAKKDIDKFIASFDEVYAIPDKVDDAFGGGKGLDLSDLFKDDKKDEQLIDPDVVEESQSLLGGFWDWIWLFGDKIVKFFNELWKKIKIPPFDNWFPPGGAAAVVTEFENFFIRIGEKFNLLEAYMDPVMQNMRTSLSNILADMGLDLANFEIRWGEFFSTLASVGYQPALLPLTVIKSTLEEMFGPLPNLEAQWNAFWTNLSNVVIDPILVPIDKLSHAFDGMFDDLPNLSGQWNAFWQGLGNVVLEPILLPINDLKSQLDGMFDGLPTLQESWNAFWEGLGNVVLEPILVPINSLKAELDGLFEPLPNLQLEWDNFWTGLEASAVGSYLSIQSSIDNLNLGIQTIPVNLPAITEGWNTFWDNLSVTASEKTLSVGNQWNTMINTMRDTGNAVGSEIQSNWDYLWGHVSGFATENWNSMGEQWNSYWSNTNTAAETNGDILLGFFKDSTRNLSEELGVAHGEMNTIWDETHADGKLSWSNYFNWLGESTKDFATRQIPNWWNENKTAVLTIFSLTGEGILAKAAGWVPKIGQTLTRFGGKFDELWATVKRTGGRWSDEMGTLFGTMKSKALGIFDDLVSGAGRIFGNLLDKVRGWMDNIKGWVSDAISSVSNINLGSFSLPGFATGGIVGKEQIVRVAEGNKREAIIPLESNAMAPFAQAVADVLSKVMPAQQQVVAQQPQGEPITVNAGVVVADDRSLRQFARTLLPFIESERRRGG